MDTLVEQLTPKQLDALRLAAAHRSSKEIARELKVTSHAIDQRLERVCAILGVPSRAEAARVYLKMASGQPIHPEATLGAFTCEPSQVPGEGRNGDQAASSDAVDRLDGKPMTLHQPQYAYAGDWMGEAAPWSWKAVLLEARQENDLSPFARTVCMGGLALLAVFIMAVVVSLAEGLSRIF